MDKHDLSEAELDGLFRAARRSNPVPDADWLARVATDAARERAHRGARATRAPSIWAQLGEAFGGWPGLGGMVAASAAGLWLGLAPPAAIGDPVGTALGTTDSAAALAGGSFDVIALLEDS